MRIREIPVKIVLVTAALVGFGCAPAPSGPPTMAPATRAPAVPPLDDSRGGQTPRLVTQTSHSDSVDAVTFTADSRWLISAGDDATIRVWEAHSGRMVYRLRTTRCKPSALAVSRDSQRLAYDDCDDIRVIELSTGRERRTLVGPRNSVVALAFSPDGRWLASGGTDKAVRLWDHESGRQIATMQCSATALRLAFSRDGRQLAFNCVREKSVHVWDLAANKEISAAAGPTDRTTAILSSIEGTWLATATDGDEIKLWDAMTGKVERTLIGHDGGALFSSDGRYLVSTTRGWDSGNTASSVNVWETQTGKRIRSLTVPRGLVWGVAISPDGRWVALARTQGIHVWEIATGEARPFGGPVRQVLALAVAPDGRSLATAGADGSVRLWDFRSGTLNRVFAGHSSWVLSVAFSPDGKSLASGGERATKDGIKIWDVESGREIRTLPNFGTDTIAYSPDGRWIATDGTTPDGSPVKLWSTSSAEVYELPGHTEPVNRTAFSGDGRRLASAGSDGTIRIWDVAFRKSVQVLRGHVPAKEIPGGPRMFGVDREGRLTESSRNGVDTVAFSPDGSLLASGGQDETVRLWDVGSGRLLHTLASHTSRVDSIAFHPNGRLLASASRFSRSGGREGIRLWEIPTGRLIRTLEEECGGITAVAFGAGGRWLASACRDGSTRLWDPDSGKELAAIIGMQQTDDWIVTTPDGLFDGSPAGYAKLIAWRFAGNETAAPEIFFNEFFRPGLLAEIAAGRRPVAPRNIAVLDRRQPVLSISVLESSLPDRVKTIRVEVADPGSGTNRAGVRDVRLFRNGSLVKAWRGETSLDANGRAVLDAVVPLVEGENRLTAYAFNRDNVKSPDASILVSSQVQVKRRGTAFVVAIGINKYANPGFNLNFAVADSDLFAAEIRRQQEFLGAFERVEAVVLQDQLATKANILRSLARLAGDQRQPAAGGDPPALQKLRRAEPEDAVIVYYAGHGIANGPRFYLIPHDLGYNGPRAALDEGAIEGMIRHGISDQELERSFEGIDAGRLLLIIDACNSGQALEAEELRRGPINSKGLAQLSFEKGALHQNL